MTNKEKKKLMCNFEKLKEKQEKTDFWTTAHSTHRCSTRTKQANNGTSCYANW